jgi:hypothetical protein
MDAKFSECGPVVSPTFRPWARPILASTKWQGQAVLCFGRLMYTRSQFFHGREDLVAWHRNRVGLFWGEISTPISIWIKELPCSGRLRARLWGWLNTALRSWDGGCRVCGLGPRASLARGSQKRRGSRALEKRRKSAFLRGQAPCGAGAARCSPQHR